MAKRDIEGELEALQATHDAELLRKSLRDKVNLIAARAAKRIGELGQRDSLPDLLAAYDRQFSNASKVDPQCWAKNALAKTLKDMEWSESEPFVRGAQYHQWEPVWGSETDTAGTLRATCLLAIPFCDDVFRDEKLWHLMRGVSDKTASVRLEAVRALEQMAGVESALLLRLKARAGDNDLSVTGQVFESLLGIEKEEAISFLVEFITQRGEPARDDEAAEQAALALGASRFDGAALALVECAENSRLENLKEAFLRSLGLSRLEVAFEYLLGQVIDGRERDAMAALSAMGMNRTSQNTAQRIRKAVEQRDSTTITKEWQRLFREL